MARKILIIEDNERNMYMLSYLLENEGFEVYKSFDGINGIDLAVNCKPDLILLDIQLPGYDGYEVARRLRNLKELDLVPIVAVSSYAMSGDKEKALNAGMTGYFEKPIDPDTFIAQIKDFF